MSGANPPAAGLVTRFAVTATVANLTANAITNVQVTVGHQANEAGFSAPSGCLDGVGGPLCPTVAANACTDGSGAAFRRCTFASVPAGSYASMNFELDLTPPAPGLRNLTGPPAALPNTTSASVQYTPASSSASFPRSETIGPACQLLVNTGGAPLLTRATLRGLRVSPATIEFALGSQQDSVSLELYGTADPGGRSGRVRLLEAPIPAAPSALGPVLYRADAALSLPYLMIEELDARGRRHVMGPVAAGDARLRAAFERIEARLERAGSVEPPTGRGRVAARQHSFDERGARRALRRRGLQLGGPSGAVAVEVHEAGPVRVPLRELAALADVGAPRRLRVSHLGEVVPHRLEPAPDGDGLVLAFDAERVASDYTDANVYVVSSHPEPPSARLTSSEEPTGTGFTRVAPYGLYLASAPEDVSPWMWDLLYGDGSAWPTTGGTRRSATSTCPGSPPGRAARASACACSAGPRSSTRSRPSSTASPSAG